MSPSSLTLVHLPAASLSSRSASWWDGVLGVAAFGAVPAVPWPASVPAISVRMPVLSAAGPVCEAWRSDEPLAAGSHGAIRYRTGRSVMFGSLEIPDGALTVAGGPTAIALQQATEAAYRELFALLDAAGFPGLLRVWNCFPAINQEHAGSERYWQFNAGRQDAFVASGRATAGDVPAASALGTSGGGFALCFVAARERPRAIENPRQVSAYAYPPQYGPRSPTFARASLARPTGGPLLFVSGTASIVGHRTLHAGDAVAQTVESLRNIDAVLGEARAADPQAALRLDELAYKIYVRNAADYAAVRAAFRERVGDRAAALFVQADVCRSDLLVEIEASGGHRVEVAR